MSARPVVPAFGNINTHLVSYTLPNVLRKITAAAQRIKVQSNPTPPEHSSPFFRLPAEMRQAIYEAAILGESDGIFDSDENTISSTSINLMQTCRQVKIEAEPIWYQRPQSFSSQAKLFAWLERSLASNLERVRTLTLHLTDVDISPLLVHAALNPTRPSTVWPFYQMELGNLEHALQSLPNLTHLTIYPPGNNGSEFPKKFYRSFLRELPVQCPRLQQLELHDTNEILSKVPILNKIPELTFAVIRHDHRHLHPQEWEQGQVAPLSPVVKVANDDDAEVLSHQLSPSPRAQRRSRVTRIVSD